MLVEFATDGTPILSQDGVKALRSEVSRIQRALTKRNLSDLARAGLKLELAKCEHWLAHYA